MRNPSPGPAKASTSAKRKCDDIEPEGKPSRPTKHRRLARSHQQHPPSRLEALPSELQTDIYHYLFQVIEKKVEKKPIRPVRPWSPSPPVNPKENITSNVTSILRVSKKTNWEAAQAFYDTVVRPVRNLPFPVTWRKNYGANKLYRSIYGVVTYARPSIVQPTRQINASHAHSSPRTTSYRPY